MEANVQNSSHINHESADSKLVGSAIVNEQLTTAEEPKRPVRCEMDPEEKILVRKLDWYIMVGVSSELLKSQAKPMLIPRKANDMCHVLPELC